MGLQMARWKRKAPGMTVDPGKAQQKESKMARWKRKAPGKHWGPGLVWCLVPGSGWKRNWATHLGRDFLLGVQKAERKEFHLLSNWVPKMGPWKGQRWVPQMLLWMVHQRGQSWDLHLELKMGQDWVCHWAQHWQPGLAQCLVPGSMWGGNWANHLGRGFLLGGRRAKRKEGHFVSNWAETMGPKRG